MRDMPSSELVSLISFLVVLLLFFSIDTKARERRGDLSLKGRIYHWVGHTGGIATGLALIVAWIDLWLHDDDPTIHVSYIAIPGSIGVLCAVLVGLEMLLERAGEDDSPDSAPPPSGDPALGSDSPSIDSPSSGTG